jgi:hypothetical protein
MLLAYDKYPMMQARKLEIYQIAIGNLSWENHGMEESRKRQRRQESAARIYGKLCRLKPDDLSFADWTKRAELNTSFFTNLKNGSDPSVTNLHSALDVIGVTPS